MLEPDGTNSAGFVSLLRFRASDMRRPCRTGVAPNSTAACDAKCDCGSRWRRRRTAFFASKQEQRTMAKTGYTRRRVMETAAAASAVFAVPFVRGAHAAGRLSVGFWDHWVPGANDTARKLRSNGPKRKRSI